MDRIKAEQDAFDARKKFDAEQDAKVAAERKAWEEQQKQKSQEVK